MKLTGLTIAAMLLGAARAGAQEPPRAITFDDAVSIALEQNATVRMAKNATALDAVAVSQAKMQFLPGLSANAGTGQSYGRTFSEAEGGIINQTTNSVSGGLSSSVVLFDGLSNVATLRQAQIGEDAGELDLTWARQTVVFSVASNYLALIQHQEQLRVQREALETAQLLEQQILAYVDAGVRPIADLYQQQATVASGRAALVEAERALSLAQVDLVQTLQLDPAGSYEFVPPSLADDSAPGIEYDLEQLLAQAYASRADLASAAREVDAADQGIRLAAGGIWPTISLSAGYNTSYSSANDFAFADQLDQRRGGSIGVGISIPIFDRGQTGAATQRAEIQADNARIALDTRRQQVGVEVRRAYLDYEAAKARLAAARAQQRAGAQALESSEERYRAGAGSLVELAQARAAAVQAESALITARHGLRFQRMLVEYYVGALNPEGPEL